MQITGFRVEVGALSSPSTSRPGSTSCSATNRAITPGASSTPHSPWSSGLAVQRYGCDAVPGLWGLAERSAEGRSLHCVVCIVEVTAGLLVALDNCFDR